MSGISSDPPKLSFTGPEQSGNWLLAKIFSGKISAIPVSGTPSPLPSAGIKTTTKPLIQMGLGTFLSTIEKRVLIEDKFPQSSLKVIFKLCCPSGIPLPDTTKMES